MNDQDASTSRLGPTDLVWDHMSRPRDEDPATRVYAAAAAGFDGIGLFVTKWRTLREDPAGVEALERALEETGLRIWGMEVAAVWGPDAAPTEDMLAFEAATWELADRFGCAYLQAIGRGVGTPADFAPAFAGLCDRAADHGVDIALEFVPSMTDIETAAQALEVIERADRPNAGLCVDSWHVTRSTGNPDDVLTLPGDRIFCVQLNDGTLEPEDPDYYTDTIANRVAPGAGEFALERMIQNLDAIGFDCPISLEVPGTELWAASPTDAATEVADGIRAVLERARPSA